ncbi:MAG: hypothetical protein ACU833_14690 [Gammaproteobacteria bacterium]
MPLSKSIPLFCWITIACVYVYCYAPGLTSPFLLDDYANLAKLGQFDGIRNAETFFHYFFGGFAGPTGRPVALLSFLIDGDNWPADPSAFKRTNIVLHFLTGILLYLCSVNLASALETDKRKIFFTALLAATIWLLHPYLVSTVLYAVQRMAMLAAFFSLLGIWLYTRGRLMLAESPVNAYRHMTGAVVGCTLLALLSKENGGLLPIFILIIETVVFKNTALHSPELNKRWFRIFLLLPSLIVFCYLTYLSFKFANSTNYGGRPFSLGQRLLTETRIVVEYLYNLLIPQMYYTGIFNENYPLSKSLTHPASTLTSIFLIAALLISGFMLKKRLPFYSLAVLFFFSGHLIESTVIPLELYYEHRNYLPSAFLFLPLAGFCTRQKKIFFRSLPLLYLALCIIFTYQRTSLWGKPAELTLFWAEQNPFSVRAQQTAAIILEKTGKDDKAMEILETAAKKIPDDLEIELHLLLIRCRQGVLIQSNVESVYQKLSAFQYTSRQFNLFETVVDMAIGNTCPALDSRKAATMLEKLISNPNVNKKTPYLYQLHHLKGKILAYRKEGVKAAEEFSIALRLSGKIEHGLVQSSLLASNAFYAEALSHLNKTETIYKNKPKNFHDFYKKYDTEISHLRKLIMEDMEHNANLHSETE